MAMAEVMAALGSPRPLDHFTNQNTIDALEQAKGALTTQLMQASEEKTQLEKREHASTMELATDADFPCALDLLDLRAPLAVAAASPNSLSLASFLAAARAACRRTKRASRRKASVASATPATARARVHPLPRGSPPRPQHHDALSPALRRRPGYR